MVLEDIIHPYYKAKQYKIIHELFGYLKILFYICIVKLKKLETQAEMDGEVPADNIVTMWKPLEFRYTVNQLLDEIS